MIISNKPITKITIKSLKDLANFKTFMETNNLKINKSQIARELNIDPRTVSKYLDGYEKPKRHNKKSKFDEYEQIIRELLSSDTQRFFYRHTLYQYLVDNYNFKCIESSFRKYLKRHPEFDEYFNQSRGSNAKSIPAIRFETGKGIQAQLDWKEKIDFVLKDTNETISVNVFVLLLSYSRFRIYRLSISKTQDILMHFLIESFEEFGGVPHEILTDNMSTVMDDARTIYSDGKVNDRFAYFASDMGFKVKPCIAASPKTKAKVESPMKILDELRAYSGQLSYVGLNDLVNKINNRVNCKINQGTGRIPINDFEKEKSFLLPLPNEKIRNSYRIKTIDSKVNSSSMINALGSQYSVPPEYINKPVHYQIHDSNIYIYSNTRLIATHKISSNKLNIDIDHYKSIIQLNFPNMKENEIDDMAKNNLKLIGEQYE